MLYSHHHGGLVDGVCDGGIRVHRDPHHSTASGERLHGKNNEQRLVDGGDKGEQDQCGKYVVAHGAKATRKRA